MTDSRPQIAEIAESYYAVARDIQRQIEYFTVVVAVLNDIADRLSARAASQSDAKAQS